MQTFENTEYNCIKGFKIRVLRGNKVELVLYENIMIYKNIHPWILMKKVRNVYIYVQYGVQSLVLQNRIFTHSTFCRCVHVQTCMHTHKHNQTNMIIQDQIQIRLNNDGIWRIFGGKLRAKCEERRHWDLDDCTGVKQTMLIDHSDSVEALLLQKGKVSSFVIVVHFTARSPSGDPGCLVDVHPRLMWSPGNWKSHPEKKKTTN